MTVKPNSLNDFGRCCRDVNRAGRVFMALFGHPVEGLTDAEKEFVAMIAADAKRMDESQEEKREKWREYTRKSRKSAKTAKVEGGVSKCQTDTPPNERTNEQTNERTNERTTEPNNARTREVAAAKPPFGSGEVSPEVKQRAEENVETLRETYVAQFVRTLRSAENCGNPDGPFYDKDVPLEYICCALAADNAVGTWRAYIHKLGADAVREECCTFYHECTAGEVPANRAAALNARLKALCDGGAQ